MNDQQNNQPLYAAPQTHNIQLLDNMFQIQAPEQTEVTNTDLTTQSTVIPAQFAYSTEMVTAEAPHAMNLAQPQVVTTMVTTNNEIATTASEQSVLIYQTGATTDQQQPQPISYKIPQIDSTTVQQTIQLTSTDTEKKKDIVAEAASEIFEDDSNKKQPVPVSQSATPTTTPLPTAIKSEPTPGPSGASNTTITPVTTKSQTPTKQSPMMRTGGPVSVGRPRGGTVRHMQRQQILPRLQLLEDEDDGLTCRMCLQSFWYKSHLIEHLRNTHSISDPERYEREEREKKMRRIREEQQRQILAKRQRMAASGRGMGMRGRGFGRGNLRGRPQSTAPKPSSGPRPSFQYRDGAFICDLCKKSFSDGIDMVTHWKSHVKKQKIGFARRGRPSRDEYYERSTTSRGRPPLSGAKRTSITPGSGRGRGRSDKGKPRWTAYLVWSTRRRKEIAEEEPDWSFAEVAKNISTEWKEVSQEDKDAYQTEADQMNASGQRKLPKEKDYGSDEWSSEDPDFDELDDVKPITSKIKKEGAGDDSYTPRSTRQRKRPSFFQEFENEENNLDKILDEFEQEQMEEAKKPKPERKSLSNRSPGATSSRRRRKREPSPEEDDEPIEIEKTRSGRVRKIRKIYAMNDPEEEEDDDDDSEDRDEYRPEEDEADEPEEEFVEEEDDEYDEEGNTSSLPPKKRGLQKNLMTDEEIEEATLKAMSSKNDGSDSDSEDYEFDEHNVAEDKGPGRKNKNPIDELEALGVSVTRKSNGNKEDSNKKDSNKEDSSKDESNQEVVQNKDESSLEDSNKEDANKEVTEVSEISEIIDDSNKDDPMSELKTLGVSITRNSNETKEDANKEESEKDTIVGDLETLDDSLSKPDDKNKEDDSKEESNKQDPIGELETLGVSVTRNTNETKEDNDKDVSIAELIEPSGGEN